MNSQLNPYTPIMLRPDEMIGADEMGLNDPETWRGYQPGYVFDGDEIDQMEFKISEWQGPKIYDKHGRG